MRIRNKMLLAMSVPIGLLVVQVFAVNHFVRELQGATSFVASAHDAIEADFNALLPAGLDPAEYGDRPG